MSENQTVNFEVISQKTCFCLVTVSKEIFLKICNWKGTHNLIYGVTAELYGKKAKKSIFLNIRSTHQWISLRAIEHASLRGRGNQELNKKTIIIITARPMWECFYRTVNEKIISTISFLLTNRAVWIWQNCDTSAAFALGYIDIKHFNSVQWITK